MNVSRIEAILAVGILILLSQSIDAETINAASCSQPHVQAAIDSATSGSIVAIPAGNCSWSVHANIPNNRRITLRGAGSSSTVITRTPAGTALYMGLSGSRVTGIGWVSATVYVDGDDWRIDHCNFTWPTFSNGIFVYGTRTTAHPRGLIDHNSFTNARVIIQGYTKNYYGWSDVVQPGSPDMVFIEDNIMTLTGLGNVVDANFAGRYVFRYNTVTDAPIESHSVQGNHRAVRMWEIYNNTLKQLHKTMWTPFFLRGGTGVVFDNTITGIWSNAAITVDNVRTAEARAPAGKCDGTSAWDGNQEPNGYPCRDQIGRSTDAHLFTGSPPYPSQALAPAYAWNNWHGTTAVIIKTHNGAQIHIKENRDYFNNVRRPGYVPYVYPHPLQATSPVQTTTAAPENFRIVP